MSVRAQGLPLLPGLGMAESALQQAGHASGISPNLLFLCRYSTNEGETWKVFTFSEKPVFVYGLLTEPGEKSTIFTIFGSYKENGHSWLILQINTTDVLGKGTGGRAISGVALQVGQKASPPALSQVSHVHVDTAADGTRVPCALPVLLPSSLRNLLKRKAKKKIPSEGLCL